MTEKELQKAVIARARGLGWRVASFPKIQDVKGVWRTPVAADGKGFPDLLLVRDRVVAMELKTGTTPTTEQFTWLTAFRLAGIEAYVIRPADWESGLVTELLLSRREQTAAA